MAPPFTRNDECEKAIRFIFNNIQNYTKPESLTKWSELARKEVGYDKGADSFRCIMWYRMKRIEDLKGFSLMEKVQLAFIFSKPVNATFVKKLKDENCIVLLNDAGKIRYFESENGDKILQSDHDERNKHFKGKPYDDRTKIYHIQVGSSENVQNSEDSTANNQKQETDDLDDGEYPEFMVPAENQPPNHHKKRPSEPSQGNPKRLKIDKPKEPEMANPPEVNDVEMRSVEVEAAQEVEQKPEDLNILKPAVKESLKIQNQDTQTRDVKIEEFLEEIEQEPKVWIPEEKTEMPPPATISLLKLAEQIETFAFNIYLNESFQQKTLRAVRLFKTNDQKIPIEEFNLLFNGMLAGLKRERIQNSNKNSIQLIRLFKQLQRTLIRPLGEDLMAEALGILDDEIQNLGDSEDEVPLKIIQIKIDGLMTLITSAWANLDQ
ncbi:hypothetical protein B9Z55_027799 [Caenorhabditis nigoni]|uniref:SPK domain-containing protein n=1 Tax=Caenorhabditis nigoni TaxID=1611254 RepID=A0A2G5SEQ3_9PELO|nr:hypothetical protein B9Z55_027799 [Caenorhabditis nigoni]